jgi:hypothetical protein
MAAKEYSAMNSGAERTGLGETLVSARAGGFFGWFHLEPVDAAAVVPGDAQEIPEQPWHRFRPSGPRFHHLVELAAGTDGDERITAACLGIDREFIAGARDRPFPRDLAKSFLDWILPDDARAVLAPDIVGIGQFCDGESPVIVAASAVGPSRFQQKPQHSGEGVSNVFIGNAAHAEQTIGPTRIVFENLIEQLPQGVQSRRATVVRAVPEKEQAAWLRIVVSRKDGPGPG